MIVRMLCIFILNILIFVRGAYPPLGDEVQQGSVLLPATRRGRYLANIVRRQAVDGTGIKFSKDADRMNAEAKKKVDVLSEELLPYIIAEQERRTTLYKRVMTAIQNGEKGVTVAEIRNKPPLIIRKGLMYRCPSNRAPREPDGSGVIMCDADIEPTPIMYDSCLSAEDKELYVAETKYFFCNRHKIEGPDLPRNGTTVIGCAPLERTSLNYTSGKCALEDTDDVVVHYRYYPDKTYKFVTELDPDHEVCDHWNPCQIGYIYSLPSPDQATTANELWRDYEERPEEYEKDEIIPPVPEDSPDEYVPDSARSYYRTSPRKVVAPDGHKFHGIGRFSLSNIRTRITHLDKVLNNYTHVQVKIEPAPPHEERRRKMRLRRHRRAALPAAGRRQEGEGEGEATTAAAPEGESDAPASDAPASDAPADEGAGETTEHAEETPAEENHEDEAHQSTDEETSDAPSSYTIELILLNIRAEDLTHYYARFESEEKPGSYKYRTIVNLHRATVQTEIGAIDLIPGGSLVPFNLLPLKCDKCTIRSWMVRAFDGGIINLDRTKIRMDFGVDSDYSKRGYTKIFVLTIGKSKFTDFGDYFAVLQTEDGNEERIKALTLRKPSSIGDAIKVIRVTTSMEVGQHLDNTVQYESESSACADVLCNGDSVISSGRVSIVTASKFVSFNFPSFENENACVYIGLFKEESGTAYQRVLQVIENSSPAVTLEKGEVTSLPTEGSQFEHEIAYQCEGECTIEHVRLNGVPLETATRRSAAATGVVFYMYTSSALTIRITSFSLFYCGIFQAEFNTASGVVTKTVLEIKNPNDPQSEAPAPEPGAEEEHHEETPAAEEGEQTTAAEGQSEDAGQGEETTAEGGEESTTATEAAPGERRKA